MLLCWYLGVAKQKEITMSLEALGYTPELEKYRQEHQLQSFEVGRVITEHRERYLVKTADEEYEAELIGNLRFTAESRRDFPAVGDWVAISPYDENKALIHALFPRHSILERQAVGRSGQLQIIATNIDYALLVQAVDRDFNINRLERYLTIAHTAKVAPIIVLSKTDLIDEQVLQELVGHISERIPSVPVVTVNNQQDDGYQALANLLVPGKTYCLLGSSGVGKSTLTNGLTGEEHMKTGAISESVKKGKHVTSHRELVVLNNGSLLIDNPGMREVGIGDAGTGLETTFDHISELAQECKYKDCSHTTEDGCAVLKALENEEIEEAAYENYQKMQREKEHFESTVQERRRKDKSLGKLIKAHKKIKGRE